MITAESEEEAVRKFGLKWQRDMETRGLKVNINETKLMVMSRVRWQDRITNEEIRRRCVVENFEHKLGKMRLRWFGHVNCRDENSILRRAIVLELEGRRPVGRPKKTCPE